MDRAIGAAILLALLAWVCLAPRRDGKPPHFRIVDDPRLKVQVQFEWKDLWVGAFARRSQVGLHIYICLIPCFPIHVTIARFPK
jgi:hypothetical protein